MVVRRALQQHMLLASMCCLALMGCAPQPVESDPAAAKKLLNDTLEAWKNGKKPEELKAQTPPIYVGDQRWNSGAKLTEFTITSDGEFHKSSVRIPVRMKTDKESKAREVYYWVSTNPANSVTLSE